MHQNIFPYKMHPKYAFYLSSGFLLLNIPSRSNSLCLSLVNEKTSKK